MYHFILPKLKITIEKWKWNDTYKIYVSNLGNLKDKDKKDIIPQIHTSGYMAIELCNNKKGKMKTLWVHRIVAETWLWHKNMWKEKLTVDHLDHNKRNNIVKNLEWVSAKENNERANNDLLHLDSDKKIQSLTDKIKNLEEKLSKTQEKITISAGGYFIFHSWAEVKNFLATLNPEYINVKIETIKKAILKSVHNNSLYCNYKWQIR